MHLGVENRRMDGYSETLLMTFTDTKEGLLAWCAHVDASFWEPPEHRIFDSSSNQWYEKEDNATLSNKVLELLKDVPCHSELFRWIQWHNLCFQMQRNLGLPAHFLYYESYTTDYNATAQELAEFLEFDIVRKGLPFVSGKTYGHLFSDEHKLQIARLIKELASPWAWGLLKHYFTSILNDDDDEPKKKDENDESDNDEDENGNEELSKESILLSTEDEYGIYNERKVVWMLSFPNSVGTSRLFSSCPHSHII
jgi:hypothetical protein